MKKLLLLFVVVAGVYLGTAGERVVGPDIAQSESDRVLAEAFAKAENGLGVEGQGEVVRVLADDTDGDRHQRFIVRLDSGQTLLVAHNIDLAPRVAGLRTGTAIQFKGEYEWNSEGGVVHWTHLDPARRHEAGWIRYEGRTYQ